MTSTRGSAPFTIRFYDGNGQSIGVDLKGIGQLAEYSAVIPVGGSSIIETAGASPTLLTGWAEITARRALGGRAVFRQQGTDGRESEAAVPLELSSSGTLLLPFDNTQGFVTGAALLNSNDSSAATLALRFNDENGQLLTTESLSLGPRSREAFFFPSRFDAVAGRRGVVRISSSTPGLGVLGLRFNPRGSFTSFEAVAPATGSGNTLTRNISQIADGDNWKTTIVVVNSGDVPAPFAVTFHSEDGTVMTVPVAGQGDVSQVFDTIPVGGSRTIETAGNSPTLAQGWAEIVTSGVIGGTAVFRQRGADGVDYEGVVQVVPSLGPSFVLPFDNTQGFFTGLAALNDGSAAATAGIDFRDEKGQLITHETLALDPKGRAAFFLRDRFPRTAGRRGVAEFSGGDITVLGLRFNPQGAFTSMAPVKK